MGILRYRDLQDEIASYSSALTSFDSCMSKSACKIVFIVGCVIAGLVVFSTLYCIVRCICCGYACCSCCCGGCGGRRPKETTVRIGPAPVVVQQPGYNEPPKYAYFEGNERSDDALPIMPSLESSKRYEVDLKEELEMTSVSGEYKRAHSPIHGRLADNQAYGGNTRRSPSPANGYGGDPAYGYPGGYGGEAQAYYGDHLPPRNPSPVSPTYPNAAPQAPGYQTYNQGYRDPYYQEPQSGWENTAHTGYNGPQNNHYQYQQPPPSSSRYDQTFNQKRQEEWTMV